MSVRQVHRLAIMAREMSHTSSKGLLKARTLVSRPIVNRPAATRTPSVDTWVFAKTKLFQIKPLRSCKVFEHGRYYVLSEMHELPDDADSGSSQFISCAAKDLIAMPPPSTTSVSKPAFAT